MEHRNFENSAQTRKLDRACDISDNVLHLDGPDTGWPIPPFSAVIDPDTSDEEVVLVTGSTATGNGVFDVVRGYDGGTAVSHASGAVVRHAAVAADFQNAIDVVYKMSTGTLTWGDQVGKGMTFRG